MERVSSEILLRTQKPPDIDSEEPVAEEITPKADSAAVMNLAEIPVLNQGGIEDKIRTYSMCPIFMRATSGRFHQHSKTDSSGCINTTTPNEHTRSKFYPVTGRSEREPETFSGFLQKNNNRCPEDDMGAFMKKKSSSSKQTPISSFGLNLLNYKSRQIANIQRKDFSSSQKTLKKNSSKKEIKVMMRQIRVQQEPPPKAKKANSCRKFSFKHSDTEDLEDTKEHFCKYLLEPPLEGTLIIDVVDNGCGMTEEEQKKLFKPFSQANKETQSQYGGTGLGMWISYKLVTAMGGTISCKSVKGEGTTFTISIPAHWKKHDARIEVSLSCILRI